MNDITYFVVGLSFWDVHVIRTPIAGTVKSIDMEGSYLDRLPTRERVKEIAFLRGKPAPVQAVITLETARGEVRIRMITSYWASRLKIWAYPGATLQEGDRIGELYWGVRLSLNIPERCTSTSKLVSMCLPDRRRSRRIRGSQMLCVNGRISMAFRLGDFLLNGSDP